MISKQKDIIKAVEINGAVIAHLKTWSSVKALLIKGYEVIEVKSMGAKRYSVSKK